MSEFAKLKPCPFCGSEAEIIQTKANQLTIRCTNKSCRFQKSSKWIRVSEEFIREKLTEQWNTRIDRHLAAEAERRDNEWLDYLRSFHRSAHDDLYDERQEKNPCADWDYQKIDRVSRLHEGAAILEQMEGETKK